MNGEMLGVSRILSETLAGWAVRYPDVKIAREVLRANQRRNSPLLRSAPWWSSAGAGAGYSGRRPGTVVHGLLHRAVCPVITGLESRHG
jgi:hypothetical protein